MTVVIQKEFSEQLLRWWSHNKRNYPWRRTRDPYCILIAEVLLHRTRADQVAPVYTRLISQFPEITSLAHASKDEIEELLQPLGLHWRVKLLFSMVKQVIQKYGGKIPSDKDQLESLPGVSHYIASAVRCFGLALPDPILDTNTVRIVGRVFGIPVSDSSRRNKKFRELYQSLMDVKRPREFNFAMIDLAALLCKPTNPVCYQCPVRNKCRHGMSAGDIT